MYSLDKDYKKAERIIKKHSKSFYLAFSKVKDKNKRRAIYGVYVFCRYADDLADDYNDLTGLNNLKNQLDEFVKNKTAPNFIFRVLKDIDLKYYNNEFNYQPYYDMLEGQFQDLRHEAMEDLADLENYSRLVASSVGNMLLPILAPNSSNKDLFVISNDLGIAMQITNILRDVGEDYRNNRIYLPKSLLKDYGVTTLDLSNGVISDNFKKLFDYLANIANTYYDNAYNLILKLFPKDTKLPLLFSLVVYRGIINECIANNYDVFSKKNSVSKKTKKELIEKVINDVK